MRYAAAYVTPGAGCNGRSSGELSGALTATGLVRAAIGPRGTCGQKQHVLWLSGEQRVDRDTLLTADRIFVYLDSKGCQLPWECAMHFALSWCTLNIKSGRKFPSFKFFKFSCVCFSLILFGRSFGTSTQWRPDIFKPQCIQDGL